MDVATDLPDGEVELEVADERDEWPAELDDELAARAADVVAGHTHSLPEILTILRTHL